MSGELRRTDMTGDDVRLGGDECQQRDHACSFTERLSKSVSVTLKKMLVPLEMTRLSVHSAIDRWIEDSRGHKRNTFSW